MVGMTFGDLIQNQSRQTKSCSQLVTPLRVHSRDYRCSRYGSEAIGSLTNPLIQDMNEASRKYLFYYLVLYDIPNQNPFRELIPMIHQHPVLLHIIVANSALHMSNSSQGLLSANQNPLSASHTEVMDSACWQSSQSDQAGSYYYALAAKQRALCLLRPALDNPLSMNNDVILAVVLLFIEFELLDSGRDDWKHHISGAKAIIEKLCLPSTFTPTVMTPLRRSLVSNFVVFDILGSTFTCPATHLPSSTSSRALSLLQDAQGNHCSSFPTELLELLQSAGQIAQASNVSSRHCSLSGSLQQLLLLISVAQSFDPLAWASRLEPISPAPDLEHRTRVAFAHRGAVLIYLTRVIYSLDPAADLPLNLDCLVEEIIGHISFISTSNVLFTATTWPAFIAGAESSDCTSQQWVTQHFHELWKVEPWGQIRGALGVLERIWEKRRMQRKMPMNMDQNIHGGTGKEDNWVADLQAGGVDWLIV
ncbi:hypothetical protein PFICI_09564 [Pestalotiopsis fici W106-1]|uniref:Acriflavine sensitivity control protein acr-2 n=1 Tax=Pestalotiopsis fici (strain W106-1 / CGMCC3.15140) TaxID=1229662 RepID=W3X3J1_PESFW|nr:uncharacterized protein PFICI_09564 [Pestalotiopsis fici W106-1]ETS79711.1 hypothetical protein PFICI_09564 [Pestalotiopsis fici W106-1]